MVELDREFFEWRKSNASKFGSFLMELGRERYVDRYESIRKIIMERRGDEYKRIVKLTKPKSFFGYGKTAMSREELEVFNNLNDGLKITKQIFGKVKFEDEQREEILPITLERVVIEK